MHARYARFQLDRLEPDGRLAAALLALASSAATAAALWLPCALDRVVALVAIGGWSCMVISRHARHRGARAPTGLRLEEDGGVTVRLGNAPQWRPVRVTAARVGRHLVTMRMATAAGQGGVSLCLTQGSMDRTRWRRLRAALLLRFPHR